MDFQDLISLYLRKTDEELLQLATQSDQLTFEAQSALRSEMGKRSLTLTTIETAVASAPSPKPETGSKTRQDEQAPQLLPVGEFIADVFRVYKEHFWFSST